MYELQQVTVKVTQNTQSWWKQYVACIYTYRLKYICIYCILLQSTQQRYMESCFSISSESLISSLQGIFNGPIQGINGETEQSCQVWYISGVPIFVSSLVFAKTAWLKYPRLVLMQGAMLETALTSTSCYWGIHQIVIVVI